MNTKDYNRYRYDNSELEKSKWYLRSYTGQIVKPEGIGKVEVEYEGQKQVLPVTIIEGDEYPMLMGLD